MSNDLKMKFLLWGSAIVLLAALIITKVIISSRLRRRRDKFSAVAEKLGFSFRPENDTALAHDWRLLKTFTRWGKLEHVFNIIEGRYSGHRVFICDYSYEEAGASILSCLNLMRRTVLIMEIKGAAFPELLVNPEIFGGIRFESVEFSRMYNVLSDDKKFAYDVFNPQMIEFFIANPKMRIEMSQWALVLDPARLLPPDLIELELNRLIEIRKLLPQYLFTKT